MDSFTILTGVAAPLVRDNIDTDTIIRIERLTNAKPQDAGAWLFESLRSPGGGGDTDFVLDRPQFRDASILMAGEDFGCGSSREGAVWALKYAGIRCVIAPSFGDIFAINCFQNFVLPVVLPADQVGRLAAQCGGGNALIVVDLIRQVVVSPRGEESGFDVERIRREALLEGQDEIGLTLRQQSEIAAFQARDKSARPWVWHPGGPATTR